MGDARIALPGTSGNYLSTADVNLLDADTAHIYQSIGGWKSNAGVTVTSTPQTPPIPPPFGTTAVKCTASAAAVVIETGRTAGKPTIDVAASTQYTASVWMYTDVVGITSARMRIYDMTGSSVGGSTIGSDTALVPGAWTEVKATRTTAAGVDRLLLLVYPAASGATVGDVFYVAAAQARPGTSSTFVPSLRIVGDLDIEAKASDNDWGNSSDRHTFLSRYRSIPSGSSYSLASAPSGTGARLSLAYNNTATTARNTVSDDLSAYLTDGEVATIRAVLDFGSNETRYYIDGVLRSTVSANGDSGMNPGDRPLHIGITSTNLIPMDGDIYFVEVRDGIDGPVVARFDAEAMANRVSMQPSASDTWTGDDTRTWTLNGADSVMEWPDLLQAGSDAVMSHLHNLDDPPESLGIVGALTEITGLSGDTEYRYALLNYLNIDT